MFRAPKYVKQIETELKEEINSNTVIFGYFSTPPTPMDRSSKININKETAALNDRIDRIDLIDIYRTFHPKVAEYTFFSSASGLICHFKACVFLLIFCVDDLSIDVGVGC